MIVQGEPVPSGIAQRPGNHTEATIRHLRCEHCGKRTEVRLRGLVPAGHYNAVADYVRAAAGNEFVLLPVATLNEMGAERERLRDALEVPGA